MHKCVENKVGPGVPLPTTVTKKHQLPMTKVLSLNIFNQKLQAICASPSFCSGLVAVGYPVTLITFPLCTNEGFDHGVRKI